MRNLRNVFFIGKMVGGPWDGGPLAVYPPKELEKGIGTQ